MIENIGSDQQLSGVLNQLLIERQQAYIGQPLPFKTPTKMTKSCNNNSTYQFGKTSHIKSE